MIVESTGHAFNDVTIDGWSSGQEHYQLSQTAALNFQLACGLPLEHETWQ